MKVRYLPILIILGAIVAIGTVVYCFYRQTEASAYESCVLSIEGAIRKELVSGHLQLKTPASDQWRVLDEEEEQIIFNKFKSEGRRFDCKQFAESENGSSVRGNNGFIKIKLHDDVLLVRIETNDGRVRNLDPYGRLHEDR